MIGRVAAACALAKAFPPIEWRRVGSVWACDRCWCQLNFTPYSCISNSFIRVELRELKLA